MERYRAGDLTLDQMMAYAGRRVAQMEYVDLSALVCEILALIESSPKLAADS